MMSIMDCNVYCFNKSFMVSIMDCNVYGFNKGFLVSIMVCSVYCFSKGFRSLIRGVDGLVFLISRRVRSVLQPESENEVCDN